MGLGDFIAGQAGKLASQLGLPFSGQAGNEPPLYVQQKELLGLKTKGDSSDFFFNEKANFWDWNGADWYKIYPYQFGILLNTSDSAGNVFAGGGGAEEADSESKTQGAKAPEYFYTLPIPPQSMVVKMQPASQVTPTIGGVVEETSENTFWFIQLAGTTGTGVTRKNGDELERQDVAKEFRKRLETTGLLAGVAANASSISGKVGSVLDAGIDAGTDFAQAAADGDPLAAAGAVAGGVTGAIQTALLPPLPYSGSQVDFKSNGFTEIQELHRFLYTYSKLKSINPKGFDLVFIDYKHTQMWNVIVQDFSIQKNSQNPHLYRYNIQLKAWNIRNLNGNNKVEFDRFGSGGDLKSVNLIELPGMIDQFGKMSEKLNLGGWTGNKK